MADKKTDTTNEEIKQEEQKQASSAFIFLDSEPCLTVTTWCTQVIKPYNSQVLVQSGKEFKLAKDTTVHPLIEIEILGKKHYTTCKKDVPVSSQRSIEWNEHVFFELRDMLQHQQDIEIANITINIKNKGFFKDELIGSFEMNATSIYFRDKHAWEHQWIAMFNPESENLTEITANLKVSFHIMTKGDEQIQLCPQSEPESPEAQLLMPAQIQQHFKQLKIRFLSAEYLPKLDKDVFDKDHFMDVFFDCSFFGKKLKTDKINAVKGSAVIDQEFWIPIHLPLTLSRLVITCKDYDAVVKDDIAGSMVFDINKLLQLGAKEGGTMYWQNLLGAPLDVAGAHTDLMNNNPEFASQWHGRVLLQVVVEDTKTPKMKVQTVDPQIRTLAINSKFFELQDYDVIAEVGQGISLPNEKCEYTVKIKIGEFEIKTNAPLESAKGYNRWSFRSDQQLFRSNYRSIERMENVFVYLMQGDTPVCYWKGDIANYRNSEPKLRWVTLKNDLAIGKVKNCYEAGMIQLKLSINSRAEKGAIDYVKQSKSWQERAGQGKSQRLISYSLRVFIYQCRDIPSADDDGLSDCYVKIWNQDKIVRTKTVEDTLNPIFYQTVDFAQDMGSAVETFSPLIFNLWDEDGALVHDDYLGTAVIHLNEPASNIVNFKELEAQGMTDEQIDQECCKVPTPKWIDFHNGFCPHSPVTGQLLVSVVIGRSDMEYKPRKINLQDYVPIKEYEINVNVLGLRDLQSTGLLPVQKPYVRFNLKSMLPPSQSAAVRNVETAHNFAGPNPNINSAIKFTCSLPTDELYCPSLTCEVFDFVFLGLSQPLIGSFSIPIGEIKRQNQLDIAAELELQEKIIAVVEDAFSKFQKDEDHFIEVVLNAMNLNESQAKTAKAIGIGQKKANRMTVQKQKTEAKLTYIPEKQNDDDEETPLLQEDSNIFSPCSANLSEEEDEMKEEECMEKQLARHREALTKLQTQVTMAEGKSELTGNSSKSEAQREVKKYYIKEQQKYLELKKAARCQLRDQDLMEKQAKNKQKTISTIEVPKYISDDIQGFQGEIDTPKPSLYKTVGYNNIKTIEKMIKYQAKIDQYKDVYQKIQGSIDYDLLPKAEAERYQEAIAAKKENQKQLIKITNKHYRMYIEDELEHCKKLFPRPAFKNYDLIRGQQRGNMSLLGFLNNSKRDGAGELDSRRTVGKFKGLISVINKEEQDQFKSRKNQNFVKVFDMIKKIYQKVFLKELTFGDFMNFTKNAAHADKFFTKLEFMCIESTYFRQLFQMQAYDQLVSKNLLQRVPATVDLYMLQGFDFAAHDIGSQSDPYLIIHCGTMVYNERDKYQLNQQNPKFNKVFSFNVQFPGPPCIVISAYDFDDLFGDDLIGKTTIDLDDRYFSVDWQALENKPIEQRQLYHPSSNLSQGVISCWMEIDPVKKSTQSGKAKKKWDLSEEPVQKFEMRVCVMDCSNVPTMDIEGTTDLYIKCWIDDKEKKSTDTHYRCMSGNGSFNYRCLIDFDMPRESKVLVLQAWDRDLFKKNEYICEWTIDLSVLIQQADYRRHLTHLNTKFYETVMRKACPDLKLEFTDDDTFQLTTVKDGKQIKIGLDIRIGAKQLISQVVGEGRTDPNFEPYLPPPIGRIKFSWNPYDMLTQLVSKQFLHKICWIFCGLLCCVAMIWMIPMIFSDVMAQLTMKIFSK